MDPTIANPAYLETNGQPIVDVDHTADPNMPLDRDWIKAAFMVPDSDIETASDIKNKYWSSASAKFTDTSLGGNIGINPRPQWTQYSDVPMRGRLGGRTDVTVSDVVGNYGMGRAYSEIIDDPSQKIYMRFGVPQFAGLATYLLRAFNREQTIIARTGRASTGWYTLGKVIGTGLALTAFPALTLTVAAGKSLAWLMGRETSKFFTLKPTMHFYWSTVNQLVINHSVNEGIHKKVMNEENEQRLGKPYKLDQDQMADLAEIFGGAMTEEGTFDVYELANRAQRRANRLFMADYEKLNNGTATDFEGYLMRDNSGDGSHTTYISDSGNRPTLAAALNRALMASAFFSYKEGEEGKAEKDPRDNTAEKGGDASSEGGSAATKKLQKPGNDSYFDRLVEHADAEFRDGSEFAIFRVDHTGSVSESFGNSTAPSSMVQKLNDVSSGFREARFSFADGNIIGGTIGNAVGSVVSAVADIAIGAADGVSLGFAGLIAGLGGSGYLDVPEHWQNSTASLPRGSYTIKLISPYGNPISRMINIWIPFYMLLAGGMPRSTGKQSYTSPYYCQIYDRGRLQSRLAMVESISVTRGTSHLPFDLYGKALAVDVTLNIKDLSSIAHLPVSSGNLLEIDIGLDEDNITSDYLAVLAGMDIYSQIYAFPKAQIKATKLLASVKHKATSPAYHASLFKNSIDNGFINSITLGASGAVSGLLQAAVRGSALTEGAVDRRQ